MKGHILLGSKEEVLVYQEDADGYLHYVRLGEPAEEDQRPYGFTHKAYVDPDISTTVTEYDVARAVKMVLRYEGVISKQCKLVVDKLSTEYHK